MLMLLVFLDYWIRINAEMSYLDDKYCDFIVHGELDIDENNPEIEALIEEIIEEL